MPPFDSALPLPGFFVGDYGGHGTEIALVRYRRASDDDGNDDDADADADDDDGHILEGFKVTGDPNIPKQKITFRAFLNKPVFPTKEQQMSKELLKEVESQAPSSDAAEGQPQRFYLPSDIYFDMDEETLPKYSRGRFEAKMQIAEHGYRNPSFTKSQLVVFNPELFGLLIFELDSFMLFQRVDVDT